jgi:hypothetical protein|tara:strand:+ start:943 stop:1092 length:150 start_codon:yes stop_codon:yes gene_type:complete
MTAKLRHFALSVPDPQRAAKDAGAFYEIKFRDPDGVIFDINEGGCKTER